MENNSLVIFSIISFIVTFIALNMKFSFLPKDLGKEFIEGGELSKGKIRGVGLIMVIVFIIMSIIYSKFNIEYLIFAGVLFLIMLSGYLDDSSSNPWGELKKGLVDFALSLIFVVSFIKFNPTTIKIFNSSFHLNPIVYGILAIILIWVSINVTNCADGIDGLCATLSIISILSYVVIFNGSTIYNHHGILFVATILAYLWFNTFPSSMLMGDAGSRAIGFFLAVLAMKSGHPLSFIFLAFVIIVDGGIGLVKVSLLRFLKIRILKDTKTPLHDEVRRKKENRNWQPPQIVVRFALIQIVVSTIFYLLLI